MPPDSVLVRSLLWLLFNAPCYSPRRHLITEAAYKRAKGGEHWKWLIDTSFQGIHDLTHESIRASRESLGMCGVATAWMSILAGVGLSVQGLIMGKNLLYLCSLALVALPILLALWHIADARLQAKTEMVRRIFELERHMRQRTAPNAGLRLSIVAHHSILCYMEEVLETCVYGTRPSPIPMHALHAYKCRVQNVPTVANQKFPTAKGDLEAQNMCPKDELLVNAARGLKGETIGGAAQINFTEPDIFGHCGSCAAFGLPTMRMPGRLKNVRQFCEYIVEVVLYKYGWQGDDKLRQDSIQFTESQLLEHSRMGRFSWYYISCVAVFNFILAGCAASVLLATGNELIYVPAFVVVVVAAVISAAILAQQLRVWRIVDGLRMRSRLNVKYGVQEHEVSAATDVALRALDVSLRAFNDRGELQSCVYWSKLVPRRAAEVVSASGGVYEVLEPGGVSSDMNPVGLSMDGLGEDMGSTKWQEMPDAEVQPGISEGNSGGYSYSASQSQALYSPVLLPIEEPVSLITAAAAAKSQQTPPQAASAGIGGVCSNSSLSSRSPDAQKWAAFQQDRASLQLVPLPASSPNSSSRARATVSQQASPQAPVAAPAGGSLLPPEVTAPSAASSAKAPSPKDESSGSSGMAMEPSFYGEACLRPSSVMNEMERTGSNAYSAISPGSDAMQQFTSIGSFGFRKRAAAHPGVQAIFGTTASPTASTCSRNSTSSPTMAQIDRHVDAAVLALQAMQSSDLSQDEVVGAKRVDPENGHGCMKPNQGFETKKSQEGSSGGGVKVIESQEGIVIDLVNPNEPRFQPTLSSGTPGTAKAPQHTAASDSQQMGNVVAEPGTGNAASGLSGDVRAAAAAPGGAFSLPTPPQLHAASAAGELHVPRDSGEVGVVGGVEKPGGIVMAASGMGSQMRAAQPDIFYDSLDFSLQMPGDTPAAVFPGVAHPPPKAAPGPQNLPMTRSKVTAERSPLQHCPSAGMHDTSSDQTGSIALEKQPKAKGRHVFTSAELSGFESGTGTLLHDILPTLTNDTPEHGPGQASVDSRDPNLQRHKLLLPPVARPQRPPAVEAATPEIAVDDSGSFPGPEASVLAAGCTSDPRALGESAAPSSAASSMHATPFVEYASGAVSSNNTIPDPPFVSATLGEMKKSNLESEFSAGPEDVVAVFSTLDVAMLAGPVAGDSAEEVRQHSQWSVYQAGNPLYQDGPEES